jgi:hypothetical protein
MTEAVESLRARVRDLTCAGKPCSNVELGETRKIVDAVVLLLRRKADNLLRDNVSSACMIAYGSDGWSGKISSTTRESDGNHLVIRRGKRHHEFLLERAFVRVLRPDGTQILHVVLDRPRGLSLGKTAWNMFSGSVEFMDTLRGYGCTGVAIQFYCMDKLHHGAFGRYIRGRNALQYQEGFADDSGEEPIVVLECLEWTVSISCKAHGCSNAVVWSLKPWAESEAFVKDAHISIASLRNSADALHGKVDMFVHKFVEQADRDHKRADVVAFLGVPWYPRWVATAFCVRRSCVGWQTTCSVQGILPVC